MTLARRVLSVLLVALLWVALFVVSGNAADARTRRPPIIGDPVICFYLDHKPHCITLRPGPVKFGPPKTGSDLIGWQV